VAKFPFFLACCLAVNRQSSRVVPLGERSVLSRCAQRLVGEACPGRGAASAALRVARRQVVDAGLRRHDVGVAAVG
jgi:hypothetical protein